MLVGGGPAGMRAALTAAERGHRVHLYEMIDRLGQSPGKTTRWTLLQDMSRSYVHVQAMTASKALEITPQGVIVETAEGDRKEIPADTVVLGVGSQSYRPLAETLA